MWRTSNVSFKKRWPTQCLAWVYLGMCLFCLLLKGSFSEYSSSLTVFSNWAYVPFYLFLAFVMWEISWAYMCKGFLVDDEFLLPCCCQHFSMSLTFNAFTMMHLEIFSHLFYLKFSEFSDFEQTLEVFRYYLFRILSNLPSSFDSVFDGTIYGIPHFSEFCFSFNFYS